MQDKLINRIYNKKQSYCFLLLLIVLGGFSLRMYNLGNYSLWYDEAKSFISSEGNFKIVWTGIIEREYPSPLYEVFIHYWKKIGESESKLRFSSVLLSVISILGIYNLGKLLFDKKAALLSSFILAISPFHIYYAQEVRPYSLLVLLTILTAIFLVKFIQTGKFGFCIGYVISHLLMIYTLYLSFSIFIAENVFFLLYWQKHRKLLRKWLIANCLILLFIVPWLIGIFPRLIEALKIKNDFWMPAYLDSVTLKSIYITFKNFTVGYNASGWVSLSSCILFGGLFIAGLKEQKNQEGITLLLCGIIIPVVGAFMTSKLVMIYTDRHLIISSMFYFLIVGNGLARIKKKSYLTLIMIFMMVLSGLAWKNYYENYWPLPNVYYPGVQSKKDHRTVSKYIIENFQKGDTVIHTCENTTYPFAYYLRTLSRLHLPGGYDKIIVRPTDNLDKLLFFEHHLTSKSIDITEHFPFSDYERVWIIFSCWTLKNALRYDSSCSKAIRWFDKHYLKIDEQRFNGIYVYLYVKK